ncbi:death domain-containing protein 1 [Lacerta agilis]|uniref:death domain-containing protein 1 n=1 Tax=Lacerta agilis TaxID=80427 RepID=UPI001419BB9E|nr:death domain-containing protein 1 [Lacerta agilis]
MEAVTNNPDQILEEIKHQNFNLGELLKGGGKDNEKIAEFLPKLTPLLLELMKAFSRQLEDTSKILQNTHQLLDAVHDKGWKQASIKEGSGLADWLQKLNKLILHVAKYFGDLQNKLLEMSCRKSDDVPFVPCIPWKSVRDANKEKANGRQLLAGASQPFHEPSSVRRGGNGTQMTEDKTVESETGSSSNENIAGKEQEFPVLVKNEDEQQKCIAVANQDNGIGSQSVLSSTHKISENRDLEDSSGNNGGNVTVSRKLENSSVEHLQTCPNQEKQTEIKEAPKQMGNGNYRLIAEPGRSDKDVNQKETSNEIAQSYQENCSRSGDLHKKSSMHLSSGELERKDDQSDWMTKEFLVKANDLSEPEIACCIRAPFSVLDNLVIRVVNDLSSLVVDGSEELVSNVIHAECCSSVHPPTIHSITIAIPFISRYRGMYKDILVKVTDVNFRSRYLTPVSLEGHQGNQKGTFAEVKTSQLGLFSVVSCLKTETVTIPKKGLSRKLSMDPRISFCWPPSTFTSRVTMHLKIQPIEPSLISMLKTKNDMYHSVVSTSPLVHLQHPSSRPFNKSIAIILPCPPNQEKKTEGNEKDTGRAMSASIPRVTTVHQFRAMSASLRKHGENLHESLKLLGYRSREEEWAVLDGIAVQNARNGLVSFELDEPLDSFIILRLSSSVDNTHLVQFVRNMEKDIYTTMVKVVLYRKKEDPYKIAVLLVPSKELNLELQGLREEGFSGPPDPSQQFKLKEGEQVYFRFSGNIHASDDGVAFGKSYKLTFHVQRKPRLDLQIKEVDEFGNYSSPHYKGTALFYKVSKEAIAKSWEQPLLPEDHQKEDLLCKLALTLPKREKLIVRPQSTKIISTDSSDELWDNLLYWLSHELSEDNASCLALCLPLHRSTLPFIKLKCPDNLTEQIYEFLCFWKRNLPRSADKLQLLSRYLHKSGRSDLVEDLRFKWESKVFWRKSHCHPDFFSRPVGDGESM